MPGSTRNCIRTELLALVAALILSDSNLPGNLPAFRTQSSPYAM